MNISPSLPSSTPLLDLGICQPVISWIYPETRQTISELWRSEPHWLYQGAHTSWQDSFHQEFLDSWRLWAKPAVTIPDDFSFAYATAGSTEAIRESLAQIAATTRGRIHIFHGEYEGFAEMAKAYGLTVIRHDRAHYVKSLTETLRPGDAFYISQPSAINGYTWSEFPTWLAFMEATCPKVRVLVDLCYLGSSSRPKRLALNHPNIHTIFFSLSKVFGVYYHRVGGVFSRTPLPGLCGNIWFKNMFSLHLGQNLLSRFPLAFLPTKYLASQHFAVAQVSSHLGIELQPSQALLLAQTSISDPTTLPESLRPLWRGTPGSSGWLRVCLTPTLDKLHA